MLLLVHWYPISRFSVIQIGCTPNLWRFRISAPVGQASLTVQSKRLTETYWTGSACPTGNVHARVARVRRAPSHRMYVRTS